MATVLHPVQRLSRPRRFGSATSRSTRGGMRSPGRYSTGSTSRRPRSTNSSSVCRSGAGFVIRTSFERSSPPTRCSSSLRGRWRAPIPCRERPTVSPKVRQSSFGATPGITRTQWVTGRCGSSSSSRRLLRLVRPGPMRAPNRYSPTCASPTMLASETTSPVWTSLLMARSRRFGPKTGSGDWRKQSRLRCSWGSSPAQSTLPSVN